MKKLHWITPHYDQSIVDRLQSELNISPVFCQMLAHIGIQNKEDARLFFRPQLEDLHDPFLMRDMEAAVLRLDRAVQNNERILLYGDYDVDGTTSVAMMFTYLSNFHKNLDYYIPDREKEGYGVSLAGVEYARTTGCGLVIAMDCGIKANKAVDLANSYGIDFIICDHHLPEGELPAAVANLDPKRADCTYPFKELSGCGVAFKLAQAYAQHHSVPAIELDHLLDFLAISTSCDLVPMIGENRVMVYYGLEKINREPRVGVLALINKCSRKFPLTVSDLVFGLGPLINAAGRLGDARETVRMLLSADKQVAFDNAAAIVARNKTRREVDYAMAEEARQIFAESEGAVYKKSIVLFNPDWHKGIIGIAASRISEEFYKPTVILTESEGRAVGSARSVLGFDLYEALQQCEDLFFSYGGHAHAAGMQMPIENVDAFTEKFEKIVFSTITKASETPVLEVCANLDFDQITGKFWKLLKQFAPFGPHNRNPVFVARNVFDTGNSKVLANNHVRFSLRQEGSKKTMSAIGFGLGDKFLEIKDKGKPFDVAFNIQEEVWRGENMLTLQIKDIQFLEQ